MLFNIMPIWSQSSPFILALCNLLGVKNADENELRSIASDPDDIHMYNVKDFSFLLDIVDRVTDNLCNSVKGSGIFVGKSIHMFIGQCYLLSVVTGDVFDYFIPLSPEGQISEKTNPQVIHVLLFSHNDKGTPPRPPQTW